MVIKKFARGAEAILFLDNKNDLIIKKRDIKEYRISKLDIKIRKSRNRREFKILEKAKKMNINVPTVKNFIENIKNNEFSFSMQYLKGEILYNCLNENLLKLAFLEIIKLHKAKIVHFDLTTLNMILLDNKIYLIDFGLSKISEKIEDRAEDLNLFFNCIKNEHKQLFYMKQDLIQLYIEKLDFNSIITKRILAIEKRGRNK